jgi:hypothetical protein
MHHQYSASYEQTGSFAEDIDSQQHFPSLASTYPDHQNSGYLVPPTYSAPLHIDTDAQAGANMYGDNRPSFQDNSTMMGHQDPCTTAKTETRMKTEKKPNEYSMSYKEAINTINEYSPDALEVIKAAHIQSTRFVILSLRAENIYVKQLLELYSNAFPGYLDPIMFQNLYAEQPEALPFPSPRPPLYASPYVPISPASSGASSPTISASNSPSPPTLPYDPRDGRIPPRMPYYIAPTVSQTLLPSTVSSSDNDGQTVSVPHIGTGAEYLGGYDSRAYESFHSNEELSKFGH